VGDIKEVCYTYHNTIPFLNFPRPQKEKCIDARPRNPYKWQRLKGTLGVRDDQLVSVKHLHSVAQDDQQMITKLFCEWITSLVSNISSCTHYVIDIKPKCYFSFDCFLRVERPVI